MAGILFRVFFESVSDFLECLRLYFTPDIVIMLRGEWQESYWPHLKMLVYFGLSIGSGFMARYSLTHYFS